MDYTCGSFSTGRLVRAADGFRALEIGLEKQLKMAKHVPSENDLR
jgi:hypothetical protein